MLKRTWLWTPIALVVLAAGSYVLYRWLTPPALPEGLLYGGGRIEGTEVTVASEVTARVLESKPRGGRPLPGRRGTGPPR